MKVLLLGLQIVALLAANPPQVPASYYATMNIRDTEVGIEMFVNWWNDAGNNRVRWDGSVIPRAEDDLATTAPVVSTICLFDSDACYAIQSNGSCASTPIQSSVASVFGWLPFSTQQGACQNLYNQSGTAWSLSEKVDIKTLCVSSTGEPLSYYHYWFLPPPTYRFVSVLWDFKSWDTESFPPTAPAFALPSTCP